MYPNFVTKLALKWEGCPVVRIRKCLCGIYIYQCIIMQCVFSAILIEGMVLLCLLARDVTLSFALLGLCGKSNLRVGLVLSSVNPRSGLVTKLTSFSRLFKKISYSFAPSGLLSTHAHNILREKTCRLLNRFHVTKHFDIDRN